MVRKGSVSVKAMAVAVLLVTAAAFLPSLFNDFVDWDDYRFVVNNDAIKSIGAANFHTIFTSSFLGMYCPFVMVTFAVEHHFFGLNPFIFHLNNYVLHLAVTALVFLFICLLTESPLTAFITAMLFGVHPLHVESVAWVTERKDLLYSFFYMLSLAAYVMYVKRGGRKYYVSCLALAVASLFSKAMAVSLPFVLLLVDYLLGRKFCKRSIAEKIPFFAAAIVMGLVNLAFQTRAGATVFQIGAGPTVYFFLKAIPFYLYKFLIPARLSAIYPYQTTITPAQAGEIAYYIAILVCLAAGTLFSLKYFRKIAFGVLFFLVSIGPVLKMPVPAGFAFAADRYMYLPSVGLLYIAAVFLAAVYTAMADRPASVRYAAGALFAAVVITLSAATWQRCLVWKNTGTLFGDMAKKYPDSRTPYLKLGHYAMVSGDLNAAEMYFVKAMGIDEGFELVHGDLTLSGLLREKLDAVRALKAKRRGGGDQKNTAGKGKDNVVSEEVARLNERGIELGQFGRLDDAIALFEEALRLDPGYAETYNNLGFAHFKKGDRKIAEDYFSKALAVDPNHEKARANLQTLRSP